MKAIVINEYGESSRLGPQTMPDPRPGAGQVTVKVAAAGVTPFDWKVRSGAYKAFFPVEFPAVLGREVSGVVTELGAGVTQFKVGDKVMGQVEHGYAELALAAVGGLALVPPGLELQLAGAIPVAALTGAQLVEEAVNIQRGQTILITGAVGAVGRFAVYAAKLRGAKVIAGVRKAQLGEAEKLGAFSTVALDDDAAIAKLPMLHGIADVVGGPTLAKLVAKVENGGVIVSAVGPPPSDAARGVVGKGFQTHSDSARLAALAQAFTAGEVTVPIARRFPLDQAAQAHQFAEKGGVGKVLLIGN